MHKTISRLITFTTAFMILFSTLAFPTTVAASSGYSLGPLSGQNGWNGGIDSLNHVLAFNVNTAGAADVVNTEAHTGTQSWYFAEGSNTPGAGTPFSPYVAKAGAPNEATDGDMVVISFAFKAAKPGDGSRIAINEGAAKRDDRTGSNIYLVADTASTVRLYMIPASQTDVIGTAVELGNFAADSWHVVEMTTVYPDTSLAPDDVNSWGTTTYKVDGTVVGTANPWAHWWRYQSGLEVGDASQYPYAPGAGIKFSNYNNDASHFGFYFDDVSYRVIDNSTHATVAAFSTSFESSTADAPVVFTAPVSGTYTTSFHQITVTFNEAINDPIGNILPDDVTNPKNFKLFQPGSNGVFDTVECSTGLQGDDTAISIDSVSYKSGLYQAVLNLNGGSNLAVGQYRLLVCGTTSLVNTLGIPLNDEPGTDSSYDFTISTASPTKVPTTSPTATPTLGPAVAASAAAGLPIPLTGFAPGQISALPKQTTAYADLGNLWLEIPALGIKASIVGVPQTADGWDVSWLGNEIGWLNGTAWPSWNGNAVLTAHVYNADGLAGPFVDLSSLKWGDTVLLHSGKSVYTYEVRENFKVNPSELSKVTKHEELPWLTLVTCSSYDPASGTYLKRVVVRAVLVEKK